MQQVQENIKKTIEELKAAEFEGQAGGAVKVTIDGQKKVKAIKIEPSVVDPEDVEMLEDLITAAFNNAVEAADNAKLQKMQAATAGLPVPPELLGL